MKIDKEEAAPKAPVIKTKACALCTIELAPGQAHLSKDHCLRDLIQRVQFLRAITKGQAKELDWERTAITATHRMAYILLENLTENKRVTLPRAKFETVDQGAGITLTELENGDFECVGVLPDRSKKEKPQ